MPVSTDGIGEVAAGSSLEAAASAAAGSPEGFATEPATIEAT
jgi:hypothetical protein